MWSGTGITIFCTISGAMLTACLLLGGDERINIVNVPWYLKA